MAAMLSNLPSPAVSERSPGIPLLATPLHFDVVVYHAGPAGIAAAAAAASSGCSVLLADPAPLAATAATDSPNVTLLRQTDIVAVHRPPGVDRITALILKTRKSSDSPAHDRLTLTCGIVIDASAAGDVLKLCGETWHSAMSQPLTAPWGTQSHSETAAGDVRTLLHADSVACCDHDSSQIRESSPSALPIQIPWGAVVPRHLKNLLIPRGDSATGKAAGCAAAQALREQTPVQQLYVPALQQRLIATGCSLISVSDVRPEHPDFAAVQWWGLQGGLHGLYKTPVPFRIPDTPPHEQSTEDRPDHAAQLAQPLSPTLAKRWQTIALIAGVTPQELPAITPDTTRGEFIRHVWSMAMRTTPAFSVRSTSPHAAPRINPAALPGTHPPGEVDNQQLAALVIRNADRLPGIVVDDCDAELQGAWQYSTHTPPYVGRGYLHDMNTGKGRKSATYRPQLPKDGWYEVRLSHCRNIRRSTNTLITISHADGQTSLRLNQQLTPEHGQLFRTLGSFRFTAGSQHWVRISNDDTTGKYVIADALQWIPVDVVRNASGTTESR